MKRILCFGDSNTYGYNPTNGQRYNGNSRWTKVLEKSLGQEYKIIEAGCNNRTAFKKNPCGIRQTGIEILPTYLLQNPDIVILFIGTNDLQLQYGTQISEFQEGVTRIIDIVRQNSLSTGIILCAPPSITQNLQKTFFVDLFDATAIRNSKKLPEIYNKIAKEKACFYLNLDELVVVSKIDGIHLDVSAHKIIGEKLAELLLNSF